MGNKQQTTIGTFRSASTHDGTPHPPSSSKKAVEDWNVQEVCHWLDANELTLYKCTLVII